MELSHLRSFVEVAERGTVAAAAAARGYSGPAVSQHLARLEAGLGTLLFDRAGGRMAVTDAGRALLPIAVRILDLQERGEAVVRAPRERVHVVVAGFASAIRTVLVPRLPRLDAHATVEIVEAEDDDALRDLGLGAVDLVLAQEYDGGAVGRGPRFTYTPLVTDPLRLVLPPSGAASATVRELAEEPWLINGRATRCAQATVDLHRRAGIRPPVVATVADNETLLALVAAGRGVTIVPDRVLEGARHAVTVADEELGLARTIHAVTRTATTPVLRPVLAVLGDEQAGAEASGGRPRGPSYVGGSPGP